MANNARRWLIESLQFHLITAFQERGFEIIPLTGEEAASREFKTAFPFGSLRRIRRRCFDLVEIQLDKHSAAAFRLSIGVAPVGGIDNPIAAISSKKMRAYMTSAVTSRPIVRPFCNGGSLYDAGLDLRQPKRFTKIFAPSTETLRNYGRLRVVN